jgi:hypothetical protein
MLGGSVYEDHTSTWKQYISLTKTAQYIARIFTIQVHEHKYNTNTWTLQNTGKQKIQKYRWKQDGCIARKME